MSVSTSEFLREAAARGFVHQCTDLAALDAACVAGPIAGYIGFDCTADSLHVGHLMQIMILRMMQRHGHRPIALMGGGTSRIGDPSFRDEARVLLDDERIATNMAGIKTCIEPFVRFGEGASDALMLNNATWLDKLGYIDLLREVGPHFSISRMLSFDSVRTRLEREQGLTFLEFNYSILQSYDFRELLRRHGCVLQIGGSDQWGNIVSGVELVRRTDAKSVYGLTTPLITTASGVKMGKTAGGAVWLSGARLAPYDYWQFWRNTEDADVGRFLRLFTDLPMEEIDRLAALGGAEINEAKKVLATEAAALVHGRNAAEQAAATARSTFETGAVSETLPTYEIAADDLARGIAVFRLLVDSGLATSLGEARRLIRGGGARVNDVVVPDEAGIVTAADLRDGAMKLSSGRKQHRLIKTT
ncbi:tyrosine--tRNA ligase [Acidisphaera sp. L21]|uniref:tyrosine--tRNA ligase n=1 Tax=Acidisphaera sp. L21 TaxID=1641851 RepID=UPI00131C23A0|nr:tyrosine--tRNA ligase [Acidisphaera sp. L21]